MITVADVTKTYGKKEQRFDALKGVSFSIPDGASVAIIGKSGSGKSTLMHCRSGLDRVTSGSVSIDDQDIALLRHTELDGFRSLKIRFIFKAFFVQGNATCAQNVALPLEIAQVSPRKRRSLVEEALQKVELSDKANEKAKNLSGGQKQRLAIARAIVGRPSIIFADEPTGNLDSKSTQLVFDIFKQLAQDFEQTIVAVTHDNDFAQASDRTIELADGSIVNHT